MPSTGKIDSIQGLRGVAALLVVADHSLLRFSERTNVHPSANDHLLFVAQNLGRSGVEIFFLISGFIMTVTSYGDFAEPQAARRFLWRRIVRIVPLYWLITALVIVQLLWQRHAPQLDQVFKSLLFIPYLNVDGSAQPLLRRGWTLNYEMFFYALFALALVLKPQRGLGAVICTLLVLSVCGLLWNAGPCASESCRLLSFYVQPIILYFAGGIILGAIRLFLQHRNKLSTVDFHHALGAVFIFTAAYIAYLCVAAPSNVSYLVEVLFCVVTTACCALFDDVPAGSRIRMMILVVGEASYSIYLTHSIFVDAAGRLWIFAFGGSGMAVYLAVMILGASLLGMLMYRYVERPTLRALRRRR